LVGRFVTVTCFREEHLGNLVYLCPSSKKVCCCLSVCRSTSNVRSFSLHWLHILKWDLVCRFMIRISRSSIRSILDRVMPLGLRKIQIIYSFRSFSLHWLHILKWNLIYRFVIRKRRSSLFCVRSSNFWQSYESWTSKNSNNLQFQFIFFALVSYIEMKFTIQIYRKNT
jgi:hypothetical protein